jgi:hypothetical protein
VVGVAAPLTFPEQIGTLAPRAAAGSHEPRHRYRIYFADGSVGTRFYDEPLRLGEQIVEAGPRLYVISEIRQEPDHGSLGRASVVEATAAAA